MEPAGAVTNRGSWPKPPSPPSAQARSKKGLAREHRRLAPGALPRDAAHGIDTHDDTQPRKPETNTEDFGWGGRTRLALLERLAS